MTSSGSAGQPPALAPTLPIDRLSLNAPGISLLALPTIIVAPGIHRPFPAYDVGYDVEGAPFQVSMPVPGI